MTPSEIVIPSRALVVLCGPSAIGKSTWSRHHFTSSQIISSDRCRQMVSDGLHWHEPGVSDAAFDLLYFWVEQRLRLNRLAVVDSTALMTGTRRHLRRIARRWNAPAVLAVFEGDYHVCRERDAARPDSVGTRVLRRQFKLLAHERAMFAREGWDRIITLDDATQERAAVRLVPLAHERPHDAGPFDIIGDIHGCRAELEALLTALGWEADGDSLPAHPGGRRLIFTGDLGCGGPDSLGVWSLVLRLIRAGRAELVVGDHDVRLARLLRGERVRPGRGLDRAAAEVARLSQTDRALLAEAVGDAVHHAPPHLLLDRGQLAVAHAGLEDSMVGKTGRAVRDFCRHGEGPRSPRRGTWIERHRGHELVVHGHTPVAEPRILNHTLNIDTGCVLGGHLTAFRWPERTLMQVPAQALHFDAGWAPAPPPREVTLEATV